MALPSLTAQERADALAKAAAARVRRAQVKADLKSGKLKLSEVLDSAEEDEAITRMKVVALLQALPRVGGYHRTVVTRRVRDLAIPSRQGLGC